MKNIYFIRHGKSAHNLYFAKNGEKAYTDILHTDSSLLEEGFIQCNTIKNRNSDFFSELFKKDDYLIIVSPLKRCLMTYICIFREQNIPLEKTISLDFVREYPCGLHTPNKRMSRSTLNYFYSKYINFDELKKNILLN